MKGGEIMDIRKEIAKLTVDQFLQFVRSVYSQGCVDVYENDPGKDTDEYMAEIAFKGMWGPMKDNIFCEDDY